jgi:hypothetical protein
MLFLFVLSLQLPAQPKRLNRFDNFEAKLESFLESQQLWVLEFIWLKYSAAPRLKEFADEPT